MYEKREPVTIEIENQKIFGVSHQPLEPRTETVVLFTHGFGGNKIGKNGFFVAMASLLAKHGIASFRFDFRGSGDSEGLFEDMTLTSLINDAVRVYEWLNAPVAVIGTSMGGLIASLLAMEKKLDALALWAPVFDAHQWQGDWQNVYKDDQHLLHKGRLVSMQFFAEFFTLPAARVEEGVRRQPLLCLRGDADEIVDPTHMEHYRKAAPDGAFMTLPGADHNFSEYHDRETLLQTTLHWFQEIL